VGESLGVLLKNEQKALVLSDLIQRSEAFRTERRKAEQEANRKRATAATGHEFRGNQYKSTEVVGPQFEVQPPADKPQTKPKRDIAKKHEKAASTALAAQVGVNRAAVERADFIRKNSLELAKKVIDGEVPASAAVREIRREQKKVKLNKIAAKEATAPTGLFDVIVIDPPWPMEKIEGGRL
jgi:hypothetical protein